jgi:hypothetical protein
MVSALVARASQSGRRVFIDYFLSLPAVTDQSFAYRCVRVLKAIPEDDWTADDLLRIRQRTEDNWELKDALVGIAAPSDESARQELLETRREGRTRMLRDVRDVRIMPEDVAESQIAALSESVRREITEARGGTFYRNDSRSLAMLNIWHPKVADWAPIYELLNEPLEMPSSLVSLTTLIRDASDQVQQSIRDQLLPRLEHVRDRPAIDFGPWLEDSKKLHTVILEAMDALAPGSVSDSELWSLIGDNNEQRCAAARIIGRRQDVTRLDILACLSHDKASIVRASAARWIAKWLENEVVAERCNALLADLAASPGTLVVWAITDGLRSKASRAAAGDWVATLPIDALEMD